ncbi:Type III pantothenate kinase [uncultured Alphaproteobacteria bacterium]|jgi:type III pantothenate kinase|uniref:Type III pantothenate kinase n=1 Tax=uncultured Alphaproteobacteria bacterium TaxID=91750 RepID=A0A212J8L8_9PROT|nr:Type III pantothenate kinase [uncultured Alphaproteobacteria bacterium]
MILTIDSGNTNVVFAVFEDGKLRATWRAANDTRRTADEFGIWLSQLMALEGIRREDITGAIIASVVPAIVYSLRSLCVRYFKVEPMVLGAANVDPGIRVLLDNPEEAGADRIANTVAAFATYGGPLIVLDFGTATTFDVVNAEGDFAGGCIAPGINLSLEALHMAAAKLPRVGIEPPPKVIGSSTVGAIKSGVFWGYVGLIEGIVKRICDEFGQPMKVVATGGLAALFNRHTEIIQHLDPDLTLRGLLQIYQRNVGR